MLTGKIGPVVCPESTGPGGVLDDVTDPTEARTLLEDLPLGRQHDDVGTRPVGPLWPARGYLPANPRNRPTDH